MNSRQFLVLTLTMIAYMRAVYSFARDISRTSKLRPAASFSVASSPLHWSEIQDKRRRMIHKAARDSLAETSKTGEFLRSESAWRNWICQGKKILLQNFEHDSLFCTKPNKQKHDTNICVAILSRSRCKVSARSRSLPFNCCIRVPLGP